MGSLALHKSPEIRDYELMCCDDKILSDMYVWVWRIHGASVDSFM